MKIIQVADPISDVPMFTENIPKHKAVVMVYMMEGCPHCENLKPKWETVKKIMQNDNAFNDIMMADIDSQVMPMVPLPPVMSFPNIKVLKDDKLTEYNGMREVDPLLKFIRKMVKSSFPHKRHRNSHKQKSTARKSHSHKRRSTARRSTARRSTARRSTARRSTARRSTARRSTARRSTARRSTARRSK